MARTAAYESYGEARSHFKDLLDAAERGRSALVKRGSSRAAVVNADRLRSFLARKVDPRLAGANKISSPTLLRKRMPTTRQRKAVVVIQNARAIQQDVDPRRMPRSRGPTVDYA